MVLTLFCFERVGCIWELRVIFLVIVVEIFFGEVGFV